MRTMAEQDNCPRTLRLPFGVPEVGMLISHLNYFFKTDKSFELFSPLLFMSEEQKSPETVTSPSLLKAQQKLGGTNRSLKTSSFLSTGIPQIFTRIIQWLTEHTGIRREVHLRFRS